MKLLRLFFLLTLALGVLTGTSRVFAVHAEYVPPAQTTTTPSVADKMATLQAIQKKGKSEHFVGTISAVDAVGFTMLLRNGTSVTILLSPNTRAIEFAADGRPRPANLATGQAVLVRAVRDANDTLTARSVLVAPSQPVRVHMIGTVTEYVPGASITVLAIDGKSYTFIINGETDLLSAGTNSALNVGSHVTIVARRDSSGGQNIALGIVVLP